MGLKSPCKGCHNELQDKIKNPECQICTKPIKYVNQVGRCPSSSMAMEVIGRNKMEEKKDQQKAEYQKPEKICTHLKCPFDGKPQPLEDFDNNSKSKDGKTRICKECRRKLQRDLRKRKKTAKTLLQSNSTAKNADTKKARSDTTKPILNIDFSNHTNIYKDLIEMANDQLRTPENQALYIFKLIHKKGLKTLNSGGISGS